jgi:hypothetical protein
VARAIRGICSVLILALAVIAFWGPTDWLPFDLSGAAISADIWIVNNASLPGFFLLFAVAGIVLVLPDLWRAAVWVMGKLTGAGPLTAAFDQTRQECRQETMFNTGQRAVFFRVLVENNTRHPKRAVNGRLAEVIRESDNYKQITHVLIGSVTNSSPPVTQFELSAQGREILDCFYITAEGEIGPPLHNWPYGFPADMFAEAGNYLFKIVINSDTDDCDVLLRLEWTGNWKTASVIFVK